MTGSVPIRASQVRILPGALTTTPAEVLSGRPATPECHHVSPDGEVPIDEVSPGNDRPVPWSVYTAAELWTDPHVAQRMLEFHLDGTVDLASRRTEFIERSVDWLTQLVSLGPGSRVLDLGCGPGLYSNRLALTGAEVVGVDFSENSLRHARQTAPSSANPTYVLGDYLTVELDGRFDLAFIAMYDYCPLSPTQRAELLGRVRDRLAPGGRFVIDVYGHRALAARTESVTSSPDLMNGFWSAEPYHGTLTTFLYPDEHVGLDRYEIVEPHRTRTIYNWLQYFDVETLTAEFAGAGLTVVEVFGDLTGAAPEDDPLEFCVVATPT